MTEGEWQACDDIEKMVAFADQWLTQRKARLFGIACCLNYSQMSSSLELAYRFADRQASEQQLLQGRARASRASAEFEVDREEREQWLAIEAVYSLPLTTERILEATRHAARAYAVELWADGFDAAGDRQYRLARGGQVLKLRDILGPLPFRSVRSWPHWLTDEVVCLASRIYEEFAYEQLSTLALALQKSGCDDPDILAHCREPGRHFRGCWVIDLLLNKDEV